ncbi:MAG: hypothetical protein K5846_00915 [Bacteroidales bacterium]|nr:hypothetical protein [Bacteroidales bacterium]
MQLFKHQKFAAVSFILRGTHLPRREKNGVCGGRLENIFITSWLFAHADKIRIVRDPSGKLTAEIRRRWEKAGEKIGQTQTPPQ